MRSPADRRRESEKPRVSVVKPIARPLLLGHRGVRSPRHFGLHSSTPAVPSENTIDAFSYAVCSGCDGFEFDVRSTSDRHSVVCHDPKLNRKEVAVTKYSELLRQHGSRIACLEEVLARFGDTVYLDIEVKVSDYEEEIVRAVSASPPKRGFVISSFLPEVLLRLNELDATLPLGYIFEHATDTKRWPDLPVSVVIPHFKLVSEWLIGEVHARGMQLFAWTVNRRDLMLRLASWGVDGLISDDPRLLADTFQQQEATSQQ
jgi:glycerophosphoryl diester phosphodiesterase